MVKRVPDRSAGRVLLRGKEEQRRTIDAAVSDDRLWRVTVAYFLERRGAAAFATAAHLGAMTLLQVLSVVAMQVAAVVTYIATVRARIVPVMTKIAAIMMDVTLITVARHPVLPDLLPLLARVSLVAFAQVLAHGGAVSCDLPPVLIDVALLLVARAPVLGQVATIVHALAAVVPQIAPVL